LITASDALVASHEHYGGLAIGGVLRDGSTAESATVHKLSWIGTLDAQAARTFLFQSGARVGVGLPFVWADFEWLANHLSHAPPVVFVVDQGSVGSTYSMDDFLPGAQPNLGGSQSALVVFTGSGLVRITATADGRAFGPSILAPFARVHLEGAIGFVEGVVVAHSFSADGSGAGSVELHARGFWNAVSCGAARTGGFAPACLNTMSDKKCRRKARKGKCARKRRVRQKCAFTCGQCASLGG